MISSLSLWPAMLGYFAGFWIHAVRHKHKHRPMTSKEWLRAILNWPRRR